MAEGADILGLMGDDDIGEKFLSIKRVKPLAVTGRLTMLMPCRSNRPTAQSEETSAGAGWRRLSDIDRPLCSATINLTEAPVLTQVANPGGEAGANDSGIGDHFDHASVLEYVASIPQPTDDEEFDSYLLAGEHLRR